MMMLSVQIYLDLSHALESPAIMGKDFLVLNKKVSMLGDGNFSFEEIEDLKKQSFIVDISP